MRTSDNITDLAAAMSKAQGEIAAAHKDSDNPFFKSKYADLASVWDACRGPLSKHGLSVIQAARAEGPIVTVESRLLHTSGQWIESELTAAAKDDGPQSIGSGITYLRRYGLQALVGVAPEDDDGAAAQGSEPRESSKPRANNPPCPKCENNEHVIKGKEEFGGGWLCWKSKGGCGHKWQDEAEPPKNGKHADVKKLAADNNMKTADELPPPSPSYQKAIDKLASAVRDCLPEEVARILNVADKAHDDGKLSDNEHKSITNECTVALRKIKAKEQEPVPE